MTTITFYSYKGGVGRSLAVANVARYLQRFGQKVFVIDFDLEAPGLHYKFGLGTGDEAGRIDKGVVDFVYDFCSTGKVPDAPLSDCVVEVARGVPGPGRLWLMPAGNVPSGTYWRKLARISWHEMFYSDTPPGIPFFLEMKQRIEAEFKPDFLLIDSRTGITEVGGVATSILPDKLVCLVMKNRENLEGAREVLRSIRNAPRLQGQGPIEIVPVLTRIPEVSAEQEGSLLKEVRDFLNENAPDLSMTLALDEVFVLHSERDLELTEAIRVGGTKSAAESPLLRDYLRLFSRLIPKEVIDPYVAPLVEEALSKSYDSPIEAERDLKAIVDYTGHIFAYRALLKFYRLSRQEFAALRTAAEMWDISGPVLDQVAWDIVKQCFPAQSKQIRELDRARRGSLPFYAVQGMWVAAGATDSEVGKELARAFEDYNEIERASRVWRLLYIEFPQDEEIVVAYLDTLLKLNLIGDAEAVLEGTQGAFNRIPAFQRVWAGVASASKDATKVERFFNEVDKTVLKRADGTTLLQLYVASRLSGLKQMLDSRLREVAKEGSTSDLIELGRAYDGVGLLSDFERVVRSTASIAAAHRIVTKIRQR